MPSHVVPVVSGLSSLTGAGVIQNFTVTAVKPYGNVSTGYTGTVTFSSSDRQVEYQDAPYAHGRLRQGIPAKAHREGGFTRIGRRHEKQERFGGTTICEFVSNPSANGCYH